MPRKPTRLTKEEVINTYTAMCDCPEIQGLWEPKEGDRIRHNSGPEGITEQYLSKELATRIDGFHGLWLPRQEDIQEMLRPEDISRHVPHTFINTHPDWNKLKAIWLWFEIQPPDYQERLMTMKARQFWLAFYMHTIHNKRWTDEGWV